MTMTTEVPTKKATQTSEGLFWFGALPASEPVEMIKWELFKQVYGDEYSYMKTCDPWEVWQATAKVDVSRQWVGKCRHFQNLDVTGMSFPAFSEILERQATSENEATATPYPGRIATLSRSQVSAVIANCYRQVVRLPQGVENMMKIQRNVQIVNLDFGKKPERMTEEEWRAYKIQNAVPAAAEFNADTDIAIAEFVYLIEIDKAPAALVRNMKTDPAKHLPTAIMHIPHQRLTEAFFKAPPKSVAEMYPIKDGK